LFVHVARVLHMGCGALPYSHCNVSMVHALLSVGGVVGQLAEPPSRLPPSLAPPPSSTENTVPPHAAKTKREAKTVIGREVIPNELASDVRAQECDGDGGGHAGSDVGKPEGRPLGSAVGRAGKFDGAAVGNPLGTGNGQAKPASFQGEVTKPPSGNFTATPPSASLTAVVPGGSGCCVSGAIVSVAVAVAVAVVANGVVALGVGAASGVSLGCAQAARIRANEAADTMSLGVMGRKTKASRVFAPECAEARQVRHLSKESEYARRSDG